MLKERSNYRLFVLTAADRWGFCSGFVFFFSKSCLNKGGEPFPCLPTCRLSLWLKGLNTPTFLCCSPLPPTSWVTVLLTEVSKYQEVFRSPARACQPFLGGRGEAEGEGLLVKAPAPSPSLEIMSCLQAVIKKHVFCAGVCLDLSARALAEIKVDSFGDLKREMLHGDFLWVAPWQILVMLECEDRDGLSSVAFAFFLKKWNGNLGAGKRMLGMLTVCSSVSFS